MKNRNDLLLDIAKCNAFSMQYFNMDIMDIIEVQVSTHHCAPTVVCAPLLYLHHEACNCAQLQNSASVCTCNIVQASHTPTNHTCMTV